MIRTSTNHTKQHNIYIEKIEKIRNTVDIGLVRVKTEFQVGHNDSKTAIMFLGNTKAGKSSIVNYVIGNDLVAIKSGSMCKIVLQKGHEFAPGPAIGSSTAAETTIPSRWKSTLVNDAIWDTPGFDDNRGIEQDVSNAFFIRELIAQATASNTLIKFVLVSDFADIDNDNIELFLNFLRRVSSIQPNINSIIASVAIIFTKVEPEIDIDYICSILDSKVHSLPASTLGENVLKLVDHLLTNKNYIGISKKIKHIGSVSADDLDVSVLDAITSIPSDDIQLLNSVRLGMSIESETFLLKAHQELVKSSELMQLLSQIKESFTNMSEYPQEKWTEVEELLEIITSRKEKYNIQTDSALLTIHGLTDLNAALSEALTEHIINTIITIDFIEKLLPIKEPFSVKITQTSEAIIERLQNYSDILENQAKSLLLREIDELLLESEHIIEEYRDATYNSRQPEGCCVVSMVKDLVYSNKLLNEPNLLQLSYELSGRSTVMLNQFINLGADASVAELIIESANEYGPKNTVSTLLGLDLPLNE